MPSVPTNQRGHQGAQAVFSDFRSGKQSLLFPGSVFHSKAYQYAAICDLNIAAVQFSFNKILGQSKLAKKKFVTPLNFLALFLVLPSILSTLVCGYEPTTLNRLHKRTQTNRIRRFTVASVYLVADASKYFPLGGSRALSSTAMAGLNYEPSIANWPWWEEPESNGRPLIFSQVYQPCIPSSHINLSRRILFMSFRFTV